jgi:regulator of sirC expression with transglutaminase-like and TPR domain
MTSIVNDRLSWQNFDREIYKPDSEIDLGKAALSYAKVEYPDLDIDKYLNILDEISVAVQNKLPSELYPLKIIQSINQYLFTELQFQGNTRNYYNPDNSFLNKVIDRQTGIPITLAVIYLEIAKRIGFPMVGIGMPGHFLIRPDFEDAEIFIDAFNQGEILFKQDCQEILDRVYQQRIPLEAKFFDPIDNRQILARMLTNLKYIYLNEGKFDRAIDYISGILLLFPENPYELRDRGLLYYELNRWQEAVQDLKFYLAILPNANDSITIEIILNKIDR